jgi:hypothetical protein
LNRYDWLEGQNRHAISTNHAMSQPLRSWMGASHIRWKNPFQALGQQDHSQCIQSMLPSIPEKPRASPTCNKWVTSAVFGECRHSLPKASITTRQKWSRDPWAVDSSICTYSSTTSAGKSYVRIYIAATNFCRALNPHNLVQS